MKVSKDTINHFEKLLSGKFSSSDISPKEVIQDFIDGKLDCEAVVRLSHGTNMNKVHDIISDLKHVIQCVQQIEEPKSLKLDIYKLDINLFPYRFTGEFSSHTTMIKCLEKNNGLVEMISYDAFKKLGFGYQEYQTFKKPTITFSVKKNPLKKTDSGWTDCILVASVDMGQLVRVYEFEINKYRLILDVIEDTPDRNNLTYLDGEKFNERPE